MNYKTDLQDNNADLQEILNLVNALPDAAEPVIEGLTVTENGTYAAPDGVDGYSPVTVNVPVPEGYVRPSGTLNITENGEYDVAEKAGVVVSVESVDYVPSSRTYEITLPKSSGLILLTTLDDDVLTHINDDNLIVSLNNTSPYVYEWYAGEAYFCGNRKIGVAQGYDIYGFANRHQSEQGTASLAIATPANNTEVKSQPSSVFGGLFYLEDKKYYMKPGDGFIRAGTYRLTFTW